MSCTFRIIQNQRKTFVIRHIKKYPNKEKFSDMNIKSPEKEIRCENKICNTHNVALIYFFNHCTGSKMIMPLESRGSREWKTIRFLWEEVRKWTIKEQVSWRDNLAIEVVFKILKLIDDSEERNLKCWYVYK